MPSFWKRYYQAYFTLCRKIWNATFGLNIMGAFPLWKMCWDRFGCAVWSTRDRAWWTGFLAPTLCWYKQCRFHFRVELKAVVYAIIVEFEMDQVLRVVWGAAAIEENPGLSTWFTEPFSVVICIACNGRNFQHIL